MLKIKKIIPFLLGSLLLSNNVIAEDFKVIEDNFNSNYIKDSFLIMGNDKIIYTAVEMESMKELIIITRHLEGLKEIKYLKKDPLLKIKKGMVLSDQNKTTKNFSTKESKEKIFDMYLEDMSAKIATNVPIEIYGDEKNINQSIVFLSFKNKDNKKVKSIGIKTPDSFCLKKNDIKEIYNFKGIESSFVCFK